MRTEVRYQGPQVDSEPLCLLSSRKGLTSGVIVERSPWEHGTSCLLFSRKGVASGVTASRFPNHVTVFGPTVPYVDPHHHYHHYLLRSLMVRICGFHPQDPGSIPGVEVCPGMTLKAFHNVCIQEV